MNCKDESNVKIHLEMSLYKYDNVCAVTKSFYVCSLYKHIEMDNKKFYDEFKSFLLSHLSSSKDTNVLNRKLIILGNFNMDFNKMPKSMDKLFADLQLKPKLLKK